MSSTSPSAYMTIFLKPTEEAHALYLLGESLSALVFKVIEIQEVQVKWGTIFPILHKEKHITLELSAPMTPKMIEEIAGLVIIGLILGFVIRGEIDLDESMSNNLA